MHNQITLNDIFQLNEEEIKNSKIELNMQAGRGGEPFIERWLNCEKEVRESGLTDCSYWGWFGNKKNFYKRQWVFSFVKLSWDEWLFVSAAEIVDIQPNSRATVKILEKFKPFFGRLIIRYKKGNTYARYVFKLPNLLQSLELKEILPCIYNGQDFAGYDNVNLPFRLLKNIFDGKIMPTYYNALQKITGVYCLTDLETGKLYIGSAYGEGGVAQRWGNYLDCNHGGNKKLISLYKEKGATYFENNFTFTLLEYFGLSYDSEKIIKREQYWKKCLHTVKFGYNDN